METNNKHLSNAETRELSLIHLLEQKDAEIQRLKILIEKYENNNKNFEEEKKQLLKKIDEYKSEDYLNVIQRISTELEETKRLLNASIKQRAFLCNKMKALNTSDYQEPEILNEHKRNIIELKAEIIQYHEENKSLKMKLAQNYKNIEELNSKIFELQQVIDEECSKNLQNGSENALIRYNTIDQILAESDHFKVFSKIHSCYSINNKIIQIILNEENQAIIKAEDESVLLRDFLQHICNNANPEDEYNKNFKLFTYTMSSKSKKSIMSNSKENFQHEKTQKKLSTVQVTEQKLHKKLPDKILKEKNYKETNSDRNKKLNI